MLPSHAQSEVAPDSATPQDDSAAIETIPVEPIAPEPAAETQPVERAASADAVELDVIEVTSSKRRQTLRDIAGSVSALRGEDLEKMKAQGLSDYLKQIPGVVLVDRGTDNGTPIIRGIAASTGNIGQQFTQLPVGIYVDDLPFTDLYIPFSSPDLNPFDLERVEVLKGPQGTLFGSGALAGAIRYILQKPKPAIWETKLSATVLTNKQGDGLSPVYGGAVNIPLYRDEAALRIVGVTRKNTGMIDERKSGKKDVDRFESLTGRILGSWSVNEKLKLSAFYFAQETEQDNTPNSDNPERFDREGQTNAFRTSGFSGTNFIVNYAFDWADLQSASSYLGKEVVFDASGHTGLAPFPPDGVFPPPLDGMDGDPDGDGGENGVGTEDTPSEDLLRTLFASKTKGFFQEFRLSSPDGADWRPRDWLGVRWLLGAAFQDSRQRYVQDSPVILVQNTVAPIDSLGIFPIGTPQGQISGARDTTTVYGDLTSRAQEPALFGEITTLFGAQEKWELTLGARLFKTDLHVSGFLAGAQIVLLDAGRTETYVDEEFKDGGVNPKASLRYIINDQFQVFALAAKGFQFGGIQFNPPVAALRLGRPQGLVPFLSSSLWNYELGLRTEFFDRRLKFDITAFYLDWTDLQITVARTLFIPRPPFPAESLAVTVGFIENLGSARSTGIESGLSISPFPGLNFTSAAAWINAVTAEDFDSSDGFVPKGTRLPAAPHFQMANTLSYVRPFPLLGEWQAGMGLTHAHLGSSFFNLQGTRRQGGYDTVDASISLAKVGGRFTPDLSLLLRNLTDVRGAAAVGGAAVGGRDFSYFLIAPRTVVLSVTVKF